jgi:hypothetical protein
VAPKPELDFCCCAGCGFTTASVDLTQPHWTSVTGAAPEISSVGHVTGGKSFRWNTVGAAAARRITRNISSDVAAARIAFRFGTLPAADVTIAGWGIIAGAAPLLRYRTATQDVCASLAANEGGGVPVVVDTWYVADLYGYTGTPRYMAIRITAENGTVTVPVGVTIAGSAASTMNGFRLGMGVEAVAVEGDVYITSIAHSVHPSAYPIGLGYGYTLRPRADGTHSFSASTDFEYNDTTGISPAATDTYTYIDDNIDNITDFLAALGSPTEYLEWLLDALPASAAIGKINGLQVASSHHSANTPANAQTLRLVDGGSTNDVFTDFDFSVVALAHYTQHYGTAPSGGEWTRALVDALKMRWLASNVTTAPYIDALVVEVDVDPRAPQARGAIMPKNTFAWL